MYIRVNMRCRCCGTCGIPSKYNVENAKSLEQAVSYTLGNLKNFIGYHKCSPTEFGIMDPVSCELMEVSDENNS